MSMAQIRWERERTFIPRITNVILFSSFLDKTFRINFDWMNIWNKIWGLALIVRVQALQDKDVGNFFQRWNNKNKSNHGKGQFKWPRYLLNCWLGILFIFYFLLPKAAFVLRTWDPVRRDFCDCVKNGALIFFLIHLCSSLPHSSRK